MTKSITTSIEGIMLVGLLIVALAVMISLNPGVLRTSATSGTNVIQANVVVSSFCQITSLSNALIQFGAVNPGTSVATSNDVLVSGTNQNVAGNVFIQGTNWLVLGGTSPNFFVANTLWDQFSVAAGVGNALNLYDGVTPGNYVDTKITVPVAGSNNIYFGMSVPAGTPGGTYAQNAILVNYCAGTGYSANANVILTVNVPSTCFIQVSNTLIQFGSVNPGSAAPTSNQVLDQDNLGNVNANIFVEGSNWIVPGSSPNFFAANTLWANYAAGAGVGNSVNFGGAPATSNFLDTLITVPFGASNQINFGVKIPGGQAAATYTTNIIIENSC